MRGFLRTYCFGPIGDAYSSRYSLMELRVQEGQVVVVEVQWMNPGDYTSVGVECGDF